MLCFVFHLKKNKPFTDHLLGTHMVCLRSVLISSVCPQEPCLLHSGDIWLDYIEIGQRFHCNMLGILNSWAVSFTQMVWRTVSKINGWNLSIEKQLMQATTEMISLGLKYTPHTAMLIMVIQKWTIFYFPQIEYVSLMNRWTEYWKAF